LSNPFLLDIVTLRLKVRTFVDRRNIVDMSVREFLLDMSLLCFLVDTSLRPLLDDTSLNPFLLVEPRQIQTSVPFNERTSLGCVVWEHAGVVSFLVDMSVRTFIDVCIIPR
jgi:hypothetical protein